MIISFKDFVIIASIILSSIFYSEVIFASPSTTKEIKELDSSHYYDSLNISKLSDHSNLRNTLKNIISTNHYYSKKDNKESLVESCPKEMQAGDKCYGHSIQPDSDTNWEYKRARKYLFGYIFLEKDKSNRPVLEGPYCDIIYTNKMFDTNDRLIREMGIPSSGVVNCEHVWPQSRFSNDGTKEKNRDLYTIKKSDLHHLRPAGNRINAIRANSKFGEVETVSKKTCTGPKVGTIIGFGSIDDFFEPRDEFKGEIARAIFYFAVRYGVKISKAEEFYLRKWHKNDPVNELERQRNQMIFNVQFNRNPFVDYPQLVNKIINF